MDIVSFFDTIAGTWFSQRTTHTLPDHQSHTSQTTLEMILLEGNDPSVGVLCRGAGVDPATVIAALQVTPEGEASTVMAVLVPIAGTGAIIQGRFLSQGEAGVVAQGDYTLQGDVLTLASRQGDRQVEERIWYLNPNLRMRTCLVNPGQADQLATFCSEIRRGVTRAAA